MWSENTFAQHEMSRFYKLDLFVLVYYCEQNGLQVLFNGLSNLSNDSVATSSGRAHSNRNRFLQICAQWDEGISATQTRFQVEQLIIIG